MTTTGNGIEFETLWDAVDVARFLKASRSWVYQKAEDNTLPSLRIGGLLRFDPAAIRAFALGGRGQVIQFGGKRHGISLS